MELRTYTAYLPVQNIGHSKELPIYVMKNEGTTLFGRKWLESIQLDWPPL